MSQQKQTSTSISLITANGEIDGFNNNFKWLDGTTPVSFILGEELTRDGLPVVYSTRPAKGDYLNTEYSPETVLRYRHELSPNPYRTRVFSVLGGQISVLGYEDMPVDVTVQLRIEQTTLLSTAESVGLIATGSQSLIAA